MLPIWLFQSELLLKKKPTKQKQKKQTLFKITVNECTVMFKERLQALLTHSELL